MRELVRLAVLLALASPELAARARLVASTRSRGEVAVEVGFGGGEHADGSGSEDDEEVGLHCGLGVGRMWIIVRIDIGLDFFRYCSKEVMCFVRFDEMETRIGSKYFLRGAYLCFLPNCAGTSNFTIY